MTANKTSSRHKPWRYRVGKLVRHKPWQRFAAVLCGISGLFGLLWATFSFTKRHYSSFSPAGIDFEQQATLCSSTYARHSIEDIQSGTRPYIFGGRPSSGRDNHLEGDPVSDFCNFDREGGGACAWRVWGLIQRFLQHSFHSLLLVTPCDLWQVLAGRTLWLSGDSQTQDLMRAVTCFLHGMTDLSWHALDPISGQIDAERHSDFATVAAKGTCSCILLPGSTRVCWIRCDDGDCMLDTVVPLLAQLGQAHDVAVINYGLHSSEDYEGSLQTLMQRVQTLRARHFFPLLVWKDTPPQHFDTTYGEYPRDGGNPPFECVNIGERTDPAGQPKWRLNQDGSLSILDERFSQLAVGGWRNQIAGRVMNMHLVPIIDTWNHTLPFWDHHRDNGAGLECTHYCFPSVPQLWVHALWKTLERMLTLQHT